MCHHCKQKASKLGNLYRETLVQLVGIPTMYSEKEFTLYLKGIGRDLAKAYCHGNNNDLKNLEGVLYVLPLYFPQLDNLGSLLFLSKFDEIMQDFKK